MLTHRFNTGFFVAVSFLLGVLVYFKVVSFWFLIIPAAVWLIMAIMGSGFVQSGYHIKALYKQNKITSRQVALTFDDGPTPDTEKVLNLLEQFNVKATFFCIGSQIEKYPHILQKIVAQGHTVGNHTYSHSNKMAIFPVDEITKELDNTTVLIQQYTNKKPLLFRPPYGVTSPNIAKALRKSGHYVIGWNVRSLDAVLQSETRIFNRIKSRLAPGSIILLHDTSQKTVNVLEQLLLLLQQQKYEAVTVNHLLNIPDYEE